VPFDCPSSLSHLYARIQVSHGEARHLAARVTILDLFVPRSVASALRILRLKIFKCNSRKLSLGERKFAVGIWLSM
jgi:hypothetical protein